MIKAILLSAIFICGVANAQGKLVERPPVNWKPIIGIEMKGGKIYIDTNSLITTATSGYKYNSVDLLASFDKPTVAMSDKEAITFRSKVHTLVIECETGTAAPVADLYFKEPIPSRGSKPIAGEMYPTDVTLTKYQVDKGSIMYNVLCPSYI